jgi:nucleotide-binding universal stress UspA family protein
VIDVVVLPLDGSPFAERAVPVAAWLAYRLDASISVISAVTRAADVPARQRQLDEAPLPPRCLERIVVVDADPAGAIHEALRRTHPSVACLASHGRGRAAAFIGSVATDVVARGHDPAVLVGPMVDPRPARCGVVACVDGTPASGALLDVAVRWAQLLAEPLVVMTVAEPVPPPLGGGAVRRRFGPEGDVETWLELVTGPARETLGAVDTAAVYDPISPVEGARRFLGDRRPSIAVIASRAYTGLSRLIHGSIASGIVYQSPSPALVVPRLTPDYASS